MDARTRKRNRLVIRILDTYDGRATPREGCGADRYLIGSVEGVRRTKGQHHALMLCADKPVTSDVLREMFESARMRGLDARPLYVYGAQCYVGGTTSFIFTQIDPRTGTVF